MIISEIGLNHIGKISFVKKYLKVLLNTNVDGITFQVREKEYYNNSKKKKYNLLDENYIEISKLIKSSKKKFGIALSDESKVDFFESIGTDFYKIIGNNITNISLSKKILMTKKKVIVSTGLSSEDDIEFFFKNFSNYKNFVLNHTQLSYNEKDCNLSVIDTLKKKYNIPVSFGSHCQNPNVLYMSLCYNPSDILFYVKLDNKIKYPDDKHSIIIDDCFELVNNLIVLKDAIGSGKKIKLNEKSNYFSR